MIDLTFIATLAVASSAIATLLLNAYVAWGNSRDKSVQLLGSIRGLATELDMRHTYLKDEPFPSGPQLHAFQDASEGIANRLAERVGAASGIISDDATKLAMKLAENLYRLRKLEISETPTTNERQRFDKQLKDVLNLATEFMAHMGGDIERYWKLRNVIVRRVKRLLDP